MKPRKSWDISLPTLFGFASMVGRWLEAQLIYPFLVEELSISRTTRAGKKVFAVLCIMYMFIICVYYQYIIIIFMYTYDDDDDDDDHDDDILFEYTIVS